MEILQFASISFLQRHRKQPSKLERTSEIIIFLHLYASPLMSIYFRYFGGERETVGKQSFVPSQTPNDKDVVCDKSFY